MKFETKYDIGQKLYRLKIDTNSLDEKCECCGHPKWDKKKWIVDDLECEIIGVYCEKSDSWKYASYKLWTPNVIVREHISEQGLESEFFLTLQQAQIECDARNESRGS